jgi:hypothetical protein
LVAACAVAGSIAGVAGGGLDAAVDSGLPPQATISSTRLAIRNLRKLVIQASLDVMENSIVPQAPGVRR